MYTLQIFLSPISMYLSMNYIPYNKLPVWAKSIFSGIYWPNQINNQPLKNGNEKNNPLLRLVFVRHGLIIKYIEDILNLITFGLYCPLLGLAISLSIIISTTMACFSIGRFIDIYLKINHSNSNELNSIVIPESIISNTSPFHSTLPSSSSNSLFISSSSPSLSLSPSLISSNSFDPTLMYLNYILKDLHSSFYQLVWIVICSSCFFVSFLCWDSASDEIGPINSIWIPLLPVIAVLSLRLIERYLRKQSKHSNNRSENRSDIERQTEIIQLHPRNEDS